MLLSLSLMLSTAGSGETGMALNPELIQIRRHLHKHPELSNRETETARYLEAQLRKLGVAEIITGVAHHGIVAVIRGSEPKGPVIAVRADMDALPVEEPVGLPFRSQNPGVMHACGHDVHMTVALGTVQELMERRKAQGNFPGTVVFLFQPAEEGAPPGEQGGAELVVKEGILERFGVQAILGLHSDPNLPVGHIGYTKGPILASSDRFEIVIRGKQTHGAFPHQGIDPVYLGSLVVLELQSIASRRIDPLDPIVVSVGIFQAGRRFNIIPETARLEGTVRTLNLDTRKKVPELMENIVQGITTGAGASYEFNYDEGPPVTENAPNLVDELLPVLQGVLGKERIHAVSPRMGAEDFAYYTQKIPGFYFWLGVRNPKREDITPLHSPEFYVDERSLTVGVKVMSAMVLKYLETHPENFDIP